MSVCADSKIDVKILLNEKKLIKEIAMRPILYDRSLKSYRKLSLRHQHWEEVGKAMNASVEDCRCRWRSLRDSFVKRHKQPKTAQIKWPFYKQMCFIAPYLYNTSSKMNEKLMADSADNSEDADSASMLLSPSSMSALNGMQEDMLDSLSHLTPPPVEEHEVTARITNSEHATSSKNLMPTELDSDEQFLLSCASVLRRLTPRKNALARLKMQQLLYDIEFGSCMTLNAD